MAVKKKKVKKNWDGLKKAAKQLPVGSRLYFIRAFKGTGGSDIYNGELSLYMKDIAEDIAGHNKYRNSTCNAFNQIEKDFFIASSSGIETCFPSM